MEVQAKMAFGRGFATPMFGPVHAVGDQLNGRGVNHMNRPFEAMGKTPVAFPGDESGRGVLKMREHRVKELLAQFPAANLVGVGKTVATWRLSRPNAHELAGIEPEPVTDIIEAQAMRQLGVDQGNHMAPRAEGAGLLVDAGLSRQAGNQMRWNEIANLLEDAELATRWLGLGFFFTPAEWQVQTQSGQRFFNSCGMLVASKCSSSR